MAESRKHHPPETRSRVRELLKRGESVKTIEERFSVSKSFIKRIKAELQKEQSNKDDE